MVLFGSPWFPLEPEATTWDQRELEGHLAVAIEAHDARHSFSQQISQIFSQIFSQVFSDLVVKTIKTGDRCSTRC